MHLGTIVILSHLWPLMYSLFGRHISFSSFTPITFEIIHTCVSIQNTNAHEFLSDSHKYFTFVSHTCSFTSMIPYVFLVWQSFLFFVNAYSVFLQFINILHLAATFVLSHLWQLMYSLFGRLISFSLFMPIPFEIIHTCVNTQY